MSGYIPKKESAFNENIKVRMFGGLGNQLFQYFAAKLVSLKLGAPLLIDFSWLPKYNIHENSDIRDFKFIQQELIEESKYSGNFVIERVKNRAVKQFKTLGTVLKIDIPNTTGYTNLGHIKKGMEMRGYYQSYRYFEEFCKIQTVHDWSLKNKSIDYQKFEKTLLSQDFISMHIRGGDYLNPNSPYVSLDEEYYMSALSEIKKHTGNIKTYIFTNDVSYGRNFLKLGKNLEILPTHNFRASENVKFMSLGRGLILSNSTFAYWVGVISGISNIAAPKKWFRNMDIDDDMYPTNWNTIN